MNNYTKRIKEKLKDIENIDPLNLFYDQVLSTKLHENIVNQEQFDYFENRINNFIENIDSTYKNLEKFNQSLKNKPIKSARVLEVIQKIDNYLLYTSLVDQLENNKENKKKIKI